MWQPKGGFLEDGAELSRSPAEKGKIGVRARCRGNVSLQRLNYNLLLTGMIPGFGDNLRVHPQLGSLFVRTKHEPIESPPAIILR
jgi:hypothetical protein